MDAATATQLLDYEIWANSRALEAIQPTPASDTRAQCVRWFAHIQAARRIWLDRMLDNVGQVVVWPETDLDAAVGEMDRMNAAFAAFLKDRSDFTQRVTYRNTAGDAFTDSIGNILRHLFGHGGYHRGQIAARLRSGGYEPLPTDFIMFVRG